MKTCRKCGEEKPLTEFPNDKKSKDGKHSYCRACERVRARAYAARNKEKVREKNKSWRARNPEYEKQWRARNPDKQRAKHVRYKERNPEKRRAILRRWQQENSWKMCEYASRRKAAKKRQMPSWLTLEQREEIKAKYRLASTLSTEKVKYHVDHIWPLRGKDAWGLHVPWNLQVITAEENLRKHNKRPDQAHIVQELAPCPN